MDLAFYQVIVEVLIPDVLKTSLHPRLNCSIRNFAKNIEQWCQNSIVNAPSPVKKSKLETVRLLSNTLIRYTTINHLINTAKTVLSNKEQTDQMYHDFGRIDFGVLHSQAEWICGCEAPFIYSIERAFRENLRQQKSFDEWTEWMEAVVDQALAKYHDKPIRVLVDASKQFLLKWNFYSSMIIRDVTCRSAPSFGSFHLLRLLYDEYMILLVEMRLAKATNQPMIGVMGQMWERSNSLNDLSTTSGLQNTGYSGNSRDLQTTTMISLNGCTTQSTTAYMAPSSHLSEPTYTHIHNAPITASASMTMVPSHSGIQYVMDHGSISPKYAAMHSSNAQAPAHLSNILVRDDPSLASIADHHHSNFGHEVAASNSNRYMMLSNHHHNQDSSSSLSSATTYTHHTQQPLGTIVYMEDILEDVHVDGTPNSDKELTNNNAMEPHDVDDLSAQEMEESDMPLPKKFKTEVDVGTTNKPKEN